jgi:hypothetical protein
MNGVCTEPEIKYPLSDSVHRFDVLISYKGLSILVTQLFVISIIHSLLNLPSLSKKLFVSYGQYILIL